MITVTINNQVLETRSVNIVQDRKPDGDMGGMDLPDGVFGNRLEVDLEFNIDQPSKIARKLTIHMPNAGNSLRKAEVLHTGLEIEFNDANWVLYRRDFKNNKLHFRELI